MAAKRARPAVWETLGAEHLQGTETATLGSRRDAEAEDKAEATEGRALSPTEDKSETVGVGAARESQEPEQRVNNRKQELHTKWTLMRWRPQT